MIIHFIGNAGAGKSSLVARVAARTGYPTPHKGFRRVLSHADWLLPIAIPLALPVCQRLSKHNRESQKGPGPGVWAGTVAMQMARRWVIPANQAFLVDHAMTNMLRKHTCGTATPLLDALPLPDMVVNVSAPQAVRKARIVLRRKVGHAPDAYLSGHSANETARALVRCWLVFLSVAETMRCLHAWNQWQCRPALTEGQLAALFAEAAGMPLTDEDRIALQSEALPNELRWLHDGYVDRGVRWYNILNDGRESLDAQATFIINKIQKHVST